MIDTQFIVTIGTVVVCTITILVAMLFMTNNLKHIEELLKNEDNDEPTCQGLLVTDRVYIYNAHEALVQATEKTKITKAELSEAIEEATSWLDEALKD